jgi:hypothetical protein
MELGASASEMGAAASPKGVGAALPLGAEHPNGATQQTDAKIGSQPPRDPRALRVHCDLVLALTQPVQSKRRTLEDEAANWLDRAKSKRLLASNRMPGCASP